MKRKFWMVITVMIMTMICTSCAQVSTLLPKTISRKNIESFLNDSIYAIGYLFAYDAGAADKTGLDGDLKVRIAASTFNTRTGNEVTDGNSYIIPGTELNKEVTGLFVDGNTDDFENNEFVSRDDKGDYHLINGDWGDTEPVYTITDSFYGIIGSEPTTLTVHYTFRHTFDDGDMRDVYDYAVNYTLVGDDSGPYSFKITDITAKNLIPVGEIQ